MPHLPVDLVHTDPNGGKPGFCSACTGAWARLRRPPTTELNVEAFKIYVRERRANPLRRVDIEACKEEAARAFS